MVLFVLFTLVLSVSLHGLLGVRLIGPSRLSARGRRAGWIALAVHSVAMPCTFFLLPLSGAPWADGLQWLGYLGMGFWSLLLIFTLFRDLLWFGMLGAQRLIGTDWVPRDPSRRKAVLRLLNLGVLGLSATVGGVALFRSRQLARVVRVRIPIADLHPALRGFRIAQVSDLHVGPTIRKQQMRQVVDAVNELGADLVAVTGDVIDGPVDRLSPHVAPLGDLHARHGVWFCTGNHEYYSGADAWCRHFETALGMHVLNDAHATVDHRGARVVIGGVTDPSARRMNPGHLSSPDRAFDGAPRGDLRLLLAHRPESAYAARKNGVHLQLSGHTHGGQYVPFTWLIRVAKHFVRGLYRYGESWIYVNPGTTYWGPPMRLGSPQEITLLELVTV